MRTAPKAPSAGEDHETAAFGFRRVAAKTRQGLVNDVFSTVAGRYDLMNDLMSGGLHRLWKDDLITWLNPPRSVRPFALLDSAAGTGDIALKALSDGGPGCRAILCDINPAMLQVGRDRLPQAGWGRPGWPAGPRGPFAMPRPCRFPISRLMP